jgi:cytoplasmic iron level regulating protein YaaA (DUF328/UPF0246 family)
MLTLLSPSKSVTAKKPPLDMPQTALLFPQQMTTLVNSLSKLSKNKLQNELAVSGTLAELNYQRYKNWDKTDAQAAIWLYSGDVYNGLDAFSIKSTDIAYAQEHLAIISGLYGLVRPLDGIKPYRLEMRLKYSGPWGKDLYQAWSQKIADYIIQTNETIIVNCASKEYAKAATEKLPKDIKVITPRFMQETDDGLKEKGLFAKYARGKLARFIIDNKLQTPIELHDYCEDGFTYSPGLSSDQELVYIVPKDFSLMGRFKQK